MGRVVRDQIPSTPRIFDHHVLATMHEGDMGWDGVQPMTAKYTSQSSTTAAPHASFKSPPGGILLRMPLARLSRLLRPHVPFAALPMESLPTARAPSGGEMRIAHLIAMPEPMTSTQAEGKFLPHLEMGVVHVRCRGESWSSVTQT
ncbi:unnamed protein product [Mycena citricolor]|uniref:Uncharacterized protein n=1 Tax=Mycena citricolor TaxID=2018698 RepID=A0AAD2K3C4_9AGAR|nr:unnamed protein product [Mycena citricolor]